MMVFNIHIITVGIVTLQGKIDDLGVLLKKLCTPGIISAVLASLIVLVKIQIPAPAAEIIGSLGSVMTPLAMIVIGFQLAQVNLMEVIP